MCVCGTVIASSGRHRQITRHRPGTTRRSQPWTWPAADSIDQSMGKSCLASAVGREGLQSPRGLCRHSSSTSQWRSMDHLARVSEWSARRAMRQPAECRKQHCPRVTIPCLDELDDWQQQSIASDPQRSAWVSANAARKMHVLMKRVIRVAAGRGTPVSNPLPRLIRKAESEMSNRVNERLVKGPSSPDAELKSASRGSKAGRRIHQNSRKRDGSLRRRSRRRVELKIQTIHALLRSAPAPVSAGS